LLRLNSVRGFPLNEIPTGRVEGIDARMVAVFSLRATKKLLDRVKQPIMPPVSEPTTVLGNWYGTVRFWKPQVALLVNERTLFPVLMPLAPAATLMERFPDGLRQTLEARGIAADLIESEVAAMVEGQYAKTANRSVLGIMNEFGYLADWFRDHRSSTDLVTLALRLSETPCGPSTNATAARTENSTLRSLCGWMPRRSKRSPSTWRRFRPMAQRPPTEDDRLEAIRRLLSGLAGGADVHELTASIADLHPKNNTFPGEVFMGLAADALEVAGATREKPIAYEGLRETYLPECEFRGRENRKVQYAILTSAAVRGGLEPDLLDEVVWWQNDDYWRYALYATVAIIRASAERQSVSVVRLVEQLIERHGVALS